MGQPHPPSLSMGGTPTAVCWYGSRVVPHVAALGAVPGSKGPMPRAEGAELDGMNPPVGIAARGGYRRHGAAPSPTWGAP